MLDVFRYVNKTAHFYIENHKYIHCMTSFSSRITKSITFTFVEHATMTIQCSPQAKFKAWWRVGGRGGGMVWVRLMITSKYLNPYHHSHVKEYLHVQCHVNIEGLLGWLTITSKHWIHISPTPTSRNIYNHVYWRLVGLQTTISIKLYHMTTVNPLV